MLFQHTFEFPAVKQPGQFIMGGCPGQLVIDVANHAVDALIYQRSIILIIRYDDAFAHLPGQSFQLQLNHPHTLVINEYKPAETTGNPHQADILGIFRLGLIPQPVACAQLLGPVDPALQAALFPLAEHLFVRADTTDRRHYNHFRRLVRPTHQELLQLIPDLGGRHMVAGDRRQTILNQP